MRGLIKMAVICSVAAIGMAAAPPAKKAAPPKMDPIKVRKAGFHEIGSAFKNIRDQLGSDSPQPMILQISARTIRDYSKQTYGWFPAGSGPGPNVKTGAKAEIWTQPAQFKAAQDAFVAKAEAYYKLAQANDIAGMKAGVRDLGGACGGCHKPFREEEKH